MLEVGAKGSAVSARNKVAPGGFSAVFFVRCLRAAGCQTPGVAGIHSYRDSVRAAPAEICTAGGRAPHCLWPRLDPRR